MEFRSMIFRLAKKSERVIFFFGKYKPLTCCFACTKLNAEKVSDIKKRLENRENRAFIFFPQKLYKTYLRGSSKMCVLNNKTQYTYL